MSVKKLSDEDIAFLRTTYNSNELGFKTKEELQKYLADKFNIAPRTMRNWLKELGITKNSSQLAFHDHPQYKKALERKIPKKDYYLISWEQNKTPYCENLLNNMEVLADYLDAGILIILGRYQNPTSLYKNDTRVNNEGWSKELEKYHVASAIDLHDKLKLRADIKIVPTATNPLSGFKGMGGTNSVIIGHPKLHMETMAMPKSYDPKIMFTTGSITYANYTESKSGVRGNEKHKLGFTLVEIKDDEVFYVRQIEADSEGNFKTLDISLDYGKLSSNNSVEALIFGDTHGFRMKDEIDKLNDKLVSKLSPEKTVFHDIIDGESVNLHHIGKPFEQYKRYENGRHLIQKELNELKDFIKEKIEKGYSKIFVVRSNHDERFDRYLEKLDWKKEIHNAKEYMMYSLAKLEGKADKGVVAYFIESNFDSKEAYPLDYDESLPVGKYEAGYHGHIGLNGSRGSLNSFNKIDIPTISAHSHTTARKDDTIVVGKNTEDDLGYNIGADNNSDSNVIVHTNGIAEIVVIIRGEISTLI